MDLLNSFLGGGVVAAALLFIQFLINRHDARDKAIICIKKKLIEIEALQRETRARSARSQILRFADELYNGTYHSKEYFDQILEEIDDYDEYCAANPLFKNSKTVHASSIIKETYDKLYKEHKL